MYMAKNRRLRVAAPLSMQYSVLQNYVLSIIAVIIEPSLNRLHNPFLAIGF